MNKKCHLKWLLTGDTFYTNSASKDKGVGGWGINIVHSAECPTIV